MSTEITETDRQRWEQLSAIVDEGLSHFVTVGRAIAAIHSDRLYRVAGYATFEECCRSRWDISRQHAYRLIRAANISHEMMAACGSAPESESTARALASVPPERRTEVWTRASQSDTVTATAVADAADDSEHAAPVTDCLGHALAGNIADAFREADVLDDLVRDLRAIRSRVKALDSHPSAAYLERAAILIKLDEARRMIQFARPYCITPPAAATVSPLGKKVGWITQKMHETLPSEMRWPE